MRKVSAAGIVTATRDYIEDISMKILERQNNSQVYEWASAEGYADIQARIIANRFSSAEEAARCITPPLSKVTNPSLLPDIDIACVEIIKAIEHGKHIVLAVDYDNDGVSSGAILYRGLRDVFGVPPSLLSIYSGVRFTEGYGLSKGLSARIADDFKDKQVLVITADMGSSDEERICSLKEQGISVIVTDHHHIPDSGIPKSALAVINPTRHDSDFGDELIAGCGVAWFLILRLFGVCTTVKALGFGGLTDKEIAEKKGRIVSLTSFASSGTIGDCVSLSASVNNRAICNSGIRAINAECYPCWTAFKSTLQEGETVNSSHISFSLAPMSNACGRLVRADAALAFLITDDVEEAMALLAELKAENEERKRIENGMREKAVEVARSQFANGQTCSVIYLDDGHPGVQGICASRVVEKFGRPTCIFSPKGDGTQTITASLRSVEGVNIRDALEHVYSKLPAGTPKTFGGHYFAAGCSIDLSLLDQFDELLNEACSRMEAEFSGELMPVLEYDGEISLKELDGKSVKALLELGPYGRGFPFPCFEVEGTVEQSILMGVDKNHLKVVLRCEHSGVCVSAVQFFVDRIDNFTQPLKGQVVRVIGEPQENWFKGMCSTQVIARGISASSVTALE